MIDWYKFDSVESLMEYVSSDECEKREMLYYLKQQTIIPLYL